MSLSPSLSALRRNRTGAVVVALQIALALAVLANTLYIVQQRLEKMGRPTRLDDAHLFGLYSVEFTAQFDYDASLREDLAWMRSLPGVIDAAPVDDVPLGGSGRTDRVSTLPDDKGLRTNADILDMDEHGIHTLGVKLLSGRNFRADEVLPAETLDIPKQVIITQALAARLFPHENALGHTLYDGDPITIIGIIDDMMAVGEQRQVAILPKQPQHNGHAYLVRTAPGRRDALMLQVQQHLAHSNPNRVIRSVRSLEEDKTRLYATDGATARFLTTVMVLILAVTALGIFSLATFNVATRTRQIGTRRAVGARRRDIVRHFLLENGLITAAGIVLGCFLALGVGFWLSEAYSLPRLDLLYLGGGVLVVFLAGQLAAWWPARRAAAVPPSVATRSV